MGLQRLLRAKTLLGFDSLPFLSLSDSLPLGEFFQSCWFFRRGSRGPGKQLVLQPPVAYPLLHVLQPLTANQLLPVCLGSPCAASSIQASV